MRLSEAIKAGSIGLEQLHNGDIINWNDDGVITAACSLGCIFITGVKAKTCHDVFNTYATIHRLFPQLRATMNDGKSVQLWIEYLNDEKEWSFTQIIQWLKERDL